MRVSCDIICDSSGSRNSPHYECFYLILRYSSASLALSRNEELDPSVADSRGCIIRCQFPVTERHTIPAIVFYGNGNNNNSRGIVEYCPAVLHTRNPFRTHDLLYTNLQPVNTAPRAPPRSATRRLTPYVMTAVVALPQFSVSSDLFFSPYSSSLPSHCLYSL